MPYSYVPYASRIETDKQDGTWGKQPLDGTRMLKHSEHRGQLHRDAGRVTPLSHINWLAVRGGVEPLGANETSAGTARV